MINRPPLNREFYRHPLSAILFCILSQSPEDIFMKTQTIKRRLLAGGVLLLSVALTACNSDDNDSSDTALCDTTLSGTAAVGAAVRMGTVTAKCQGGATFTQTVKTDNDGKWRGFVKKEALPCALQVTGGTPSVTLHSYATTGGIVNITPLTDLMIAEQTRLSPSAWFAAFDASVAIDINDTTLTEALKNARYSVPAGNPFTTSFNANGKGWDGLLDDLGAAIKDDVNLSSYEDLLVLVKDGNFNSIPAAPADDTGGGDTGGGDGGTCGGNAEGTSELPAGNDLISTCAGEYDIAFVHRDEPHARGTVTIGEDNSVDFDTGIVLPATEISTVFNRISCCNRIDIDYTNGDKVKLYRTDDGILRNVHYELSGGTAVKVSMLPQLLEGDGDASALTSSNLVVSGTVKGEVKIQETVFGTKNPITGNFGVFEVRGQGHQTTVPTTVWTLTNIPAENGTHYCQPFDSALQVTYLRVSDSGAAQSGGGSNAVGRCTVTVTDIQTNPSNPAQIIGAEGKFAVELLGTGPDTGKLVDVVTDGYFRFFPE